MWKVLVRTFFFIFSFTYLSCILFIHAAIHKKYFSLSLLVIEPSSHDDYSFSISRLISLVLLLFLPPVDLRTYKYMSVPHRFSSLHPLHPIDSNKMVFGALLVAGAVGLASYGIGKRRERRQVANGYVSYHNDDDYANIHYGSKPRPYAGRYQQQYPTAAGYSHYTTVQY